jgi:hypothetical protein
MTEILPWVVVYLIGAVGTVLIAGMVAESETGKVRKWWATVAAFWLLWPIAWPVAIAYAIVYGCTQLTRYMWSLRG